MRQVYLRGGREGKRRRGSFVNVFVCILSGERAYLDCGDVFRADFFAFYFSGVEAPA
jgi:hypothetical protein